MSLNHPKTELIVALDFPRPDKAYDFVQTLEGLPVIYKMGLELFMGGGPDLVRELVRRKNRIFLDLKFHDIPTTAARAVKQAALLHVEMVTAHLSGGSAMFRAISEELSDIPLLRPKILGISVLTSFDDVRWAEVTRALTGHAADPSESGIDLIEISSTWGIDGIVCSAFELKEIRKRLPGLYTVVPGVRPPGTDFNDQARITTPKEARDFGAHAIVVGRPITRSEDPRAMTLSILNDIAPEKVGVKTAT